MPKSWHHLKKLILGMLSTNAKLIACKVILIFKCTLLQENLNYVNVLYSALQTNSQYYIVLKTQ